MLRRGPVNTERAWEKGKDCRHSIGVANEPSLRLEYTRANVVVCEQPFAGAMAVARGIARVIDGRGKPIQQKTQMVICVHGTMPDSLRPKAGIVVDVIDPGRKHRFFILPWPGAPIVSKKQCRPVGTCEKYADASCGNCCNNKKKSKK